MVEIVGGGPVTADSQFFTLEEFKEFAGITGSSQDARLAYIVSGTNAAVHKYLKRRILSEEHTEYLDGQGYMREMYLREYPVSEIKSIHVCGEEFTDFLLEGRTGLVWSNNFPWPEGFKNIKVVYQAGYSEVPDDLKMAAMELAQETWRDVKKGKKIASEKIGDYSYTLVTNTSVESLISARRVLGSYRRVQA